MLTVNAYAATSPTEPLVPTTITRRDVGPRDVLIEIAYAGVCHSDIHTVRVDWGPITYPEVVGHEVAGTVVEVGTDVTKHAAIAAVSVRSSNSCRECDNCRAGEEQYCLQGNTQAHCSVDRDGTIPGRVLHPRRRRRGLRPPHPCLAGLQQGRPAAVRRHHDVFTAASLHAAS
jgi:uncharacterized zinc-type alcohol dehydrogenase-like protein